MLGSKSSIRPFPVVFALVARLGGDEFAVMVHDPGDAQTAGAAVARRILDAFVLPVAVGAESVSVYLSIGIAAGSAAEASREELIRDADVAMYRLHQLPLVAWAE
jgi:diguanylate cyclase (GGDEF)-like protein